MNVATPPINPSSDAHRAGSIPSERSLSARGEIQSAPVEALADIQAHEITNEYHSRIAIAREELATLAFGLGDTPIYNQMVYERFPDDGDALEILEVFGEIEAHRERRVEDLIIEANTMGILLRLGRIIKGEKSLLDSARKFTTRNEIAAEFVNIEGRIGGEAFSSFLTDPDITEQHFFFTRNNERPDQVDCFYTQHSENLAKNVTIWYKVTPKGIVKTVSYNHHDRTVPSQVQPMIKNAQYDETLALKIGTELYRREVLKHFAEPSKPRHNAVRTASPANIRLPKHRQD